MPIREIDWKAGVGSRPADPLQVANDACAKCVHLLSRLIIKLQENSLKVEHRQLLRRIFLLGERDAIPERLGQVLTATRDGLRDIPFKLTIQFFNFANKSNQSEMTLAVAQFNNENQILRYMIHEATHAFAGTDDHSDRGYINNDGNYRQPGLAPLEAIKNADSFACFVVLRKGIPLA